MTDSASHQSVEESEDDSTEPELARPDCGGVRDCGAGAGALLAQPGNLHDHLADRLHRQGRFFPCR